MKLYEIDFIYEAPVEEGSEELFWHKSRFHLTGDLFKKVYAEAMVILDDLFENYEIIKIKWLEKINILNIDDNVEILYEGADDVGCPYCEAKNTVLDKVMKFECPNAECKEPLVVADNGWTALYCKNCGMKMEREEIVRGKNGKFIYVAKEEKKE